MSIFIQCPGCDARVAVPPTGIDPSFRCARCGHLLGSTTVSPSSTVLVTCPACNASGKAPADRVGKTVRCRKCRIVIRVPVPEAASLSSGFASTPVVPRTILELPPPVDDENAPRLVPKTTLSLSPFDGLGADSGPPVDEPSSGDRSHEEENEQPVVVNKQGRTIFTGNDPVAITSLVLGSVSLPIAIVPCFGMFSLPVSFLGAVFGTISLAVTSRGPGSRLWQPVTGLCLNLVAAMIGSIWILAAIHGGGGSSKPKVNNEEPAAVVPGDENKKAPPSDTKPVPPSPPVSHDAFIDASKDAARVGDVEVRVTEVRLGEIELTRIGGGKAVSTSPHLSIRLTIKNVSETRKLTYETWASRSDRILDNNPSSLADDLGNKYKRVNFGLFTKPVGQAATESILPDRTIEDVLIFEEPVGKASHFMLTLPLKAIDSSSNRSVTLKIPATMIRREK